MPSPRLLVIQHNLDDGLNELGAPLAAAGLRIDVWDTRLSDEPDHPLAAYDGIVSLGGLDSATDEVGRPAVTAERELLAGALDRRTPILGICFGAQLLARAAGGSCRPAPQSEVGWCRVDLEAGCAGDPLLDGLSGSVQAFQYHYDTFDLPAGATVLARGGGVVQAYRLGDRAWGLQFHLEANPGQIYGWLGSYAGDMRKAGVDLEELRTSTAAFAPTYRDLTWRIGAAFAAVVATEHDRRSAALTPA